MRCTARALHFFQHQSVKILMSRMAQFSDSGESRFWARPWQLQARIVHSWRAHREGMHACSAAPSEDFVVSAGRAASGGREADVLRVWDLAASTAVRFHSTCLIKCRNLSSWLLFDPGSLQGSDAHACSLSRALRSYRSLAGMVVAGIMRIVLHAACPVICNGEQHRDCRRQLH